MENKKPRKISLTILWILYNFLHISKSGQKKKRRKSEQRWAEIKPGGPGPRGIAPAPTRWRLYRKGLRFLANWRQVLSLFTVSLTICRRALRFLFLRSAGSTTASHAAELRRAVWTGRMGPWLGSPSDWHEIESTPTISPNPISSTANWFSLATVTMNMADWWTCSREFMAVQYN